MGFGCRFCIFVGVRNSTVNKALAENILGGWVASQDKSPTKRHRSSYEKEGNVF
jgi:hypothetical protein